MASSRGTKQSRGIKDNQFQKLLTTMTAGLNPIKPSATFSIIPGQYSIEEVIDYSKGTGIKICQ